MKIIIFDGTFKTTAFINRLIQGLVKNGMEVYVLGFNEELKTKIPEVKYIPLGSSTNKIRFIKTALYWSLKSKKCLSYLKWMLKGDKNKIKQYNLRTALDSIQPNIIHLQWVSNINLFEPFLRENKYKFILSQRGFQSNVRPFVNQENYNYLEKWLPKFDGFHSVSKAISKVGNKLHQCPDKIDQVVYTGLDLAKFDFNAEVIQHKKLKIVSVGRPHWIKGYDLAVRALHQLKQAHIQFQYQIVGAKGNEELIFLINDLGLNEYVLLLDKMPQTQVFELMKESDVLLLPSIEEGIPNVTIEAMALGTPVISTQCGNGILEIITNNEEGWIVPRYSIDSMAEQIFRFSQLSKDQILKVKKAARKKVEMQHNEELMLKNMIKLYTKV